MEHSRPCFLLKAQLIGFFLMVVGYISAFWTPVQALERCESVDLRTAIRQVAEQNMPAVVSIEATQSQEVDLPFEEDPFFRYFFNIPPIPGELKREFRGVGTGILMDRKGHILTSNHLAKRSSALQVLLADGRQYPAKLVGADPKTNLAVIRISVNEPLPHVKFGDSDEVALGDWVVAIGYPRGLGQIVTQGIIGSRHRAVIKDIYGYQDFLQTDATISQVNIGGPLFNLSGEVIGIISAIVSKSSGFEGISFVIPSNTATDIAGQLLANGQVARGWIGASIRDLTPELARSFGLEMIMGAFITHVMKGGPADRAGIKVGDVVAGYRGKKVPDSMTLQNEVDGSPLEEEVKVTVIRNGKKQGLIVRIENLQEAINRQASFIRARLGIDVRPATSEELKRYGMESKEGLVITWVHPDSPLAKIGFEVKDMMLEINGQPIASQEDFEALVNALEADQQIILLGLDHRSGRSGYVQAVVP